MSDELRRTERLDLFEAVHDALRHLRNGRVAQAQDRLAYALLRASSERQAIGDLLAVILGDGGHHVADVGMTQACKDALDRVRADRYALAHDPGPADEPVSSSELPPMPRAAVDEHNLQGGRLLYTYEQMHAYARAALASAAAPKAEPTDEPVALTFDAFRHANVTRCVKWHPSGIDSWSASDWMTAIVGELGEAASLIKMRNRERDGLPGNKFSPTDKQIADELADVLTYLDLLAAMLGIDLGRAAAVKFNEVSERVGFPDRIAVPAAPQQPTEPKP